MRCAHFFPHTLYLQRRLRRLKADQRAGALRRLPPRCTGRSGNMGYARFFSHPVPPQLRCTKAGERGRERCGPCLRVVRGEVEIWAMPVFSHTLYLHSFAAQRPGSVGGSAAAPASALYGEKWKYGLCPFFLTPCTSTASLHKGRGAWAGALRPLPSSCRVGRANALRAFALPTLQPWRGGAARTSGARVRGAEDQTPAERQENDESSAMQSLRAARRSCA